MKGFTACWFFVLIWVTAVVVAEDDRTHHDDGPSPVFLRSSQTENPSETNVESIQSQPELLASSKSSACSHIHPADLPHECLCTEPSPYSLVISCTRTFDDVFFQNDTIGLKIDLEPCDPQGSRLSIDVTESKHDIDYIIAGVKAGEEQNIPIPGLSIIVPGVGHVGLDVTVYIAGNPDHLQLKVGLNACAAMHAHGHEKLVCASSIPGLNKILPWYILSGTYSFGHFCNSSSTTTETSMSLLSSQNDETLVA